MSSSVNMVGVTTKGLGTEATVSGSRTNVSYSKVVRNNRVRVCQACGCPSGRPRLVRQDGVYKSTPAPRLVGVEPNPGPLTKAQKAALASALISAPKGAAKKAVAKHSGQKKKKKRSSGKVGRASSSSMGLTSAYIRTLADPWQNAGIPLGWGTMVTTTCSQAYARGTATSNADGTCTLLALPFVSQVTDTTSTHVYGLITTLTAGLNSAVSAYPGCADSTAIQSNYGTIRPISIGIRAYPNLAATSAPGTCFVGTVPSIDVQTLALLTTADYIAMPTSHMCPGISGASATGRPVDASSFIFSDDFLLANESDQAVGTDPTTRIPFSVPYISFTGIGNATSIAYEVVYNFEGTPKIAHSSGPLAQNESGGPRETLASYWSSFENMWGSVKGMLPPSGRPSFGAAIEDNEMLSSAFRTGAGFVLRNYGAAFGRAGLSLLAGGYGGAIGGRLLRS